jgi:hypothetical protein
LRDLKSLEYLGLKDTAVGDAGLAELKGLTGLNTLNLANTKLTDAGLVHLAGLTRLEGLNLSNDAITDAGPCERGTAHRHRRAQPHGDKDHGRRPRPTESIPKLTKLNLTGTAVTDQGVKDAKSSYRSGPRSRDSWKSIFYRVEQTDR